MTDTALLPLPPGDLVRIGSGALDIQVAPAAGGRIAGVRCDGVEWLCGYAEDNAAAIAWGCYPMLPWAGRIRDGRFRFEDRDYQLPASLGPHAIHGVGFLLPWTLTARTSAQVEMTLDLPEGRTWPFGGSAHQRIAVNDRTLRLELSVSAVGRAMPGPVLGWHPWFRKPDKLDFTPSHCYPRDAAGIATTPPGPVPPNPWDDCFINSRPVLLERSGRRLRLTSGCEHWVVFDERAHATCVEPQSGPPDAFNLEPARRLAPGETAAAWFQMQWL
jgi:aldose 1-epimerase